MYNYYYKEPGKKGEIRAGRYDERKYEQLGIQEYVGHAYLDRNLYVYFDDLGIKNRKIGRLYNCNIPSKSKFQNQIFGNLIIEKVSGQSSVDITESDIVFIESILFEVPENEWYTEEDVKKFWNNCKL
ncbi:MAG: hypothetical protein FWE36_08150 [Erysipelotrichales bacterium]|nr:hypothetical protein [Erysipelotrichales bacterium]